MKEINEFNERNNAGNTIAYEVLNGDYVIIPNPSNINSFVGENNFGEELPEDEKHGNYVDVANDGNACYLVPKITKNVAKVYIDTSSKETNEVGIIVRNDLSKLTDSERNELIDMVNMGGYVFIEGLNNPNKNLSTSFINISIRRNLIETDTSNKKTNVVAPISAEGNPLERCKKLSEKLIELGLSTREVEDFRLSICEANRVNDEYFVFTPERLAQYQEQQIAFNWDSKGVNTKCTIYIASGVPAEVQAGQNANLKAFLIPGPRAYLLRGDMSSGKNVYALTLAAFMGMRATEGAGDATSTIDNFLADKLTDNEAGNKLTLELMSIIVKFESGDKNVSEEEYAYARLLLEKAKVTSIKYEKQPFAKTITGEDEATFFIMDEANTLENNLRIALFHSLLDDNQGVTIPGFGFERANPRFKLVLTQNDGEGYDGINMSSNIATDSRMGEVVFKAPDKGCREILISAFKSKKDWMGRNYDLNSKPFLMALGKVSEVYDTLFFKYRNKIFKTPAILNIRGLIRAMELFLCGDESEINEKALKEALLAELATPFAKCSGEEEEGSERGVLNDALDEIFS